MESSVGRCGVCGRGKPFSTASFRTGNNTRVHWIMWYCGHTSRAAVGADDLDGELLESPSYAAPHAVEAVS